MILAGPFLKMADQEVSADESCPNDNGNNFVTTIGYNITAEQYFTSPRVAGLNPVAWTYIMSGAFRVRLDWTRSNAKRRLATFASGRLRHSRRLPTFARGC